ncbi:MAG: pyruvate kinase [Minisyncoccia bacterium]
MHYQKKKTQIVATIGPASESVEMLEKLVNAGLNVARCNMSHGNHESHAAQIKNIRTVAEKLDVPLPVLLDLSGPKIRTGDYVTERITIETGREIIITTEEIVGDASRISVNYPKLPQEVETGTNILVDDGKKILEVMSVDGTEIRCRIVMGGELKSRRGVNVPGAHLSIATITEKDREDLAFGLQLGVDIVTLSFVRRAEDVRELRALMEKAGNIVPIIVKIETQEAIDNLDAILAEADGAMVARGDLAVEVPTEMVPLYQKEIIGKCNLLGKPVITATQMLESMIHSPVPTRAEVSDIANAINDGTDAVMLSEESALGEYPVEAVSMMSRIAETIEKHQAAVKEVKEISIQDSISKSVWHTARMIHARIIVTLTESGTTARLVSRFRPACPIIALTPNQKTLHSLALSRGVYSYEFKSAGNFDANVALVKEFIQNEKLAQEGDSVVIAAGLDFGVRGSTNMLFVLKI